ncbi:hypothetical protein LF599_11920 [Pseudodesulfovibrio thermohalotolerans]|uniref:hypothetical protein n=1 Tax=Pseudodesulfovibrio thermohalotolerans TaxID=2880651 RepID=UPI002441088E|nr:hypothetical protein [Pseudodesulfovibrio thermohalotolerans]WFS61378.1 hypothetical protein LF599_11920 [Pseudodesulfovibrio thermohalotolerans]
MRVEPRTISPGWGDTEKHPFAHGVVRFDGIWSLDEVERAVNERGLSALAFEDVAMFADHAKVVAMCLDMRVRDLNVLWSARMDTVPTGGLLKAMRLAGCQRLEMRLDPDEAVEGLFWARRYGFEVCIRNLEGASYAAERISYTVAEREAITDRLPGLHAAQFDLAVAYFQAGRLGDVMLPLGKAMTLRFPMNDLCLNLLACLSAAKHYPDQAAGLLDQAGYGCPHPVIFRNRELLRTWLAGGGDVKGVRLNLEPEHSAFS